ncbi:DUF4192 domain-containing protein [Amycolatopsis pigmentata]|uniref:DUF4192 domain-containing protein n=1 Tax=Amycolatopsis pigmentata TaxID=450801 RepID=A0ABW5FVY5_9PSEU
MTSLSVPPDSGIVISVNDPAHLIAAVPHLLGFRPADSVVVIGFGGANGKRVDPLVRTGLPAPGDEGAVAAMLATVFARQPGRAVAVLVVGSDPGPPPDPGDVPHRRFVTTLAAAFEARGRPVESTLWTPEIRAGSPWRRYDEPECPGVLPDDSATPVAAAVVSKGFVTFDSREEMERQLDADDPAAVARRERLLRARAHDAPADVAEAFREVRSALGPVDRGEPDLPDERVLRLAVALSQPRVRDACLAVALPPGSERSLRAEALWLALTRKLPAPERAEPAVLLGFSAYVRGDGALARAVLDKAVAAMPGHRLARLLLACLDSAVPPARLHRLGLAEELSLAVAPV